VSPSAAAASTAPQAPTSRWSSVFQTAQSLFEALTGHVAPQMSQTDMDLLKKQLEKRGLHAGVPFKRHQYEGIRWMLNREAAPDWKGGILADEMGLGKTLQMLCVMAINMQPTLVICPLSALKSWKDDADKFFAAGTFRVIDYHALRQCKVPLPPLPANAMVLINPESVGRDVWSKMEEKQGEQSTNELSRQLSNYCYVDPTWTLEQLQERASDCGIDVRSICGTGDGASFGTSSAPRGRVENMGSELLRAAFGRVVCDEAQFLKNLTSNKTETINAAACKRLGDHVKTRWCMTGTPAENNIKDYFSLLTFLHAEPFCRESWFKNHVERYVGKDALNPTHDPEFHRCFKDTMLRRGKEKLQNLPRPHFCLVKCWMTEEELKEEEALLNEEEGPGRQLVGLLRSSQAAGSMAKCRAKIQAQVKHLLLPELLGLARRSVTEGGLGQELGKAGSQQDASSLEWCRQKFCFERAWIEADKDEVLQSSKWKTLRELLETIWSRGSKRIDCVRHSMPNSPGDWPWKSPNGIEATSLKTDPTSKVVLISKLSTRAFELAERMLRQMNRSYCRIDQSTPPGEKRDAIINEFNSKPSLSVMLLGMKCGGTGINLPGAKVAILLDPWWNSAAEQQAIHRIHRLNSTHEDVYFFKLLSENNSAERRSTEIQQQKLSTLSKVLTTE